MAELVWDQVGNRQYETGLDRGVLYLSSGVAIPWSGLVEVTENVSHETSAVHFDGKKINDFVIPGDFAASLKAITYPEKLTELEGLGKAKAGIYYGEQSPTLFDLSYRTKIGNDLDSEAGYKIHILYNVTAVPKGLTYATVSESPVLTMFEWEITAIPEEVPGFRPTAHIIIDSTETDPWLLAELEAMLYGTPLVDSDFPPMADLVSHISTWYRIQVTDNGDGTWTVDTPYEDIIEFGADGYFEITAPQATYLNSTTYELSE